MSKKPIFDSVFTTFDQSMEDLFGSTFVATQKATGTRMAFALERRGTDLYEAWIDMPGVKKEDVCLEIKFGRLTASGKRTDTNTDISYHRTVQIGNEWDENSADAKISDGVLYIRLLPHHPSSVGKKIEIK